MRHLLSVPKGSDFSLGLNMNFCGFLVTNDLNLSLCRHVSKRLKARVVF